MQVRSTLDASKRKVRSIYFELCNARKVNMQDGDGGGGEMQFEL